MKILLDTHAFLWFIHDDKKLSETAKKVFLNPKNTLYFSAANLWEIGIKVSLGKLDLKESWFETIQTEIKVNDIQWLPIKMQHCKTIEKLPFYHRDPFDRMLIGQANFEKMTLLSCDEKFAAYDVDVIW